MSSDLGAGDDDNDGDDNDGDDNGDDDGDVDYTCGDGDDDDDDGGDTPREKATRSSKRLAQNAATTTK